MYDSTTKSLWRCQVEKVTKYERGLPLKCTLTRPAELQTRKPATLGTGTSVLVPH